MLCDLCHEHPVIRGFDICRDCYQRLDARLDALHEIDNLDRINSELMNKTDLLPQGVFTIDWLQETLANLANEKRINRELTDNLTAVQTRCTQLFLENCELRTAIEKGASFVGLAEANIVLCGREGRREKMSAGTLEGCPLCSAPTTTSICAQCAEDLTALGAVLPGPDATREEIQAWAKAEKITVFRCNPKEHP